jgi:hypothetical protein
LGPALISASAKAAQNANSAPQLMLPVQPLHDPQGQHQHAHDQLPP